MIDFVQRLDDALDENDRLNAECERFKRGLILIAQSGAMYGGAWCASQALGHFLDLDFDAYPETGQPESLVDK